jgi:hypothetical protein
MAVSVAIPRPLAVGCDALPLPLPLPGIDDVRIVVVDDVMEVPVAVVLATVAVVPPQALQSFGHLVSRIALNATLLQTATSLPQKSSSAHKSSVSAVVEITAVVTKGNAVPEIVAA